MKRKPQHQVQQGGEVVKPKGPAALARYFRANQGSLAT
jgi:hypothetical protein